VQKLAEALPKLDFKSPAD